jgi:hypothetical protein
MTLANGQFGAPDPVVRSGQKPPSYCLIKLHNKVGHLAMYPPCPLPLVRLSNFSVYSPLLCV